ncbi:hypothetical protein GCM10012275_37450 [Longimycelium tulufanense]|uniref:Uncharacterized protein n=1 Tax=Longimycelium tulufanense TaxID=907463 RepID=A0A8J3CGF1_9PSEU|nr:hypothetical protein GCM10012275_37450 [Longimycelium tulufanense]
MLTTPLCGLPVLLAPSAAAQETAACVNVAPETTRYEYSDGSYLEADGVYEGCVEYTDTVISGGFCPDWAGWSRCNPWTEGHQHQSYRKMADGGYANEHDLLW